MVTFTATIETQSSVSLGYWNILIRGILAEEIALVVQVEKVGNAVSMEKEDDD